MNVYDGLVVEVKIPELCVEEYMNDKFQSAFTKVIEDIENMQYKIDTNCENMDLKTGEGTLDTIRILKYAFRNARIKKSELGIQLERENKRVTP